MSGTACSFVAFEPITGGFLGSISIDSLISLQRDPEKVLSDAAQIYELHIMNMRKIVAGIEEKRSKREKVPARDAWALGNEIFSLTEDLARFSLELDGLYNHLVRDLGVKRKWLEKVIILRRYIPNPNRIPESFTWGYFEKGTRRKAIDVNQVKPNDE